ncbi:MAG: aminotransferase class I/II-fold pyridoxal phosphate-dependent enzyme [Micrococcales bacterium]|nr:aminotransferase class I/II-fold pyridoxal phosphate-dependent enzyme [Micrococcales bacterium]
MRRHDPDHRDFASDNHAGLHPQVLAALAEANGGHVHSYGDDPYSKRLSEVVAERLGPQARAFPVFNGTGANVVALSAMAPRWGSVVTPTTAHLHTDEAGAPERMAGLKVLTVPDDDGRLTVAALSEVLSGGRGVHSPQPSVVALAQATELGTVYTPDDLTALTTAAHARGLRVYMDGARLANAAAHLDLPLRALTTDVGVDVVSLGGTKNGAFDAEVVVVLDPSAAEGIEHVRKMDAQLSSKARFAAAQLLALYETDLWLDLARHANLMAVRLAEGLSTVPGARVVVPVQANAVFTTIPAETAAALRERWTFHDWTPDGSQVRLMCAWDTTEHDVDAFVAAAHEASTSPR